MSIKHKQHSKCHLKQSRQKHAPCILASSASNRSHALGAKFAKTTPKAQCLNESLCWAHVQQAQPRQHQCPQFSTSLSICCSFHSKLPAASHVKIFMLLLWKYKNALNWSHCKHQSCHSFCLVLECIDYTWNVVCKQNQSVWEYTSASHLRGCFINPIFFKLGLVLANDSLPCLFQSFPPHMTLINVSGIEQRLNIHAILKFCFQRKMEWC